VEREKWPTDRKGMIDFQEIKSRHPIEAELERRGVKLRRATGGYVARCPIHNGTKGWAFSVNTEKQVWYCFSACRRGGDVFDLVMELDGAADAKAAAEILEGRPLTDEERTRPAAATRSAGSIVRAIEARALPAVPKMYLGEERHHRAVAELRKLQWTGIAEAQKEGCLRFCVAYDQPAYAILDASNPCNVQVRRMDGRRWFDESGADGKKVMGVKGNWASWPVGLAAALRHPAAKILWVEGTGDVLAGWDVRMNGIDVIPCGMFGAGQPIHDGALACLEGREVIIVQQHDHAGEMATKAWHKQLMEAHAKPRVWPVPGVGEDLNNFISGGGDPFVILNEARSLA
jgi:hypothetical protein